MVERVNDEDCMTEWMNSGEGECWRGWNDRVSE